MERVLEFMRLVEKDHEFFKLTARISKKLYDAYVAEGFTREEALQLTLHSSTGLKFSE